MPEILPTPASLRIGKFVARVAGWVLVACAGTATMVLVLLVNQPDGEIIPVVTAIEDRTGTNLIVPTAVCLFVSLVGALICLLIHQIQIPIQELVTQDEILKVTERLTPIAMQKVLDGLVRQYADVVMFDRLVKDLEREGPRLKAESIELAAAVAIINYRLIEPLKETIETLASNVAEQEDAAILASEAIETIRNQIGKLEQRISSLQSQHGDVSGQAVSLQEYLDVLSAELRRFLPPSATVHRLAQPGE